jgi:pseudaminic acid biosynthesis-associated methylase
VNGDFRTEQEAFWAGSFGDEYIDRNQGERLVACNTALLGRILSRTAGIATVIEFGSNIGLNLVALKRLLPQAELSAIEINAAAARQVAGLGVTVHHGSILEIQPPQAYDLVLASRILIHIAADDLELAYQRLHQACGRYLCIAEYYNPTPVEVPYRGHLQRLFKRDFAGEVLERFPDLRLLDYGFVYHRDTAFPQDDLTWFLLERTPTGAHGEE